VRFGGKVSVLLEQCEVWCKQCDLVEQCEVWWYSVLFCASSVKFGSRIVKFVGRF